MKHIRSLVEANLSGPSIVTIGAFDGVHTGHQHLISNLIQQAASKQAHSVVLTFYPHPQIVIGGPEPGFYLTLPDTKAALLGELGVELVVTHHFDEEIRHLRAVEYVDRLIRHLNMIELWVGEDFALGYRREGTVDYLTEQARLHDFELRVVSFITDHLGQRISSTRIRQALAAGAVDEARKLLGRPYRVTGIVTGGAQRGRTIGIPTANLQVSEENALPAVGVYAAYATIQDRTGKVYRAVVNTGRRPTFDGSSQIVVEAHLLDFSDDIYGHELSLDFVSRIRDEIRFSGVAELVAQIHADIQHAENVFG